MNTPTPAASKIGRTSRARGASCERTGSFRHEVDCCSWYAVPLASFVAAVRAIDAPAPGIRWPRDRGWT